MSFENPQTPRSYILAEKLVSLEFTANTATNLRHIDYAISYEYVITDRPVYSEQLEADVNNFRSFITELRTDLALLSSFIKSQNELGARKTLGTIYDKIKKYEKPSLDGIYQYFKKITQILSDIKGISPVTPVKTETPVLTHEEPISGLTALHALSQLSPIGVEKAFKDLPDSDLPGLVGSMRTLANLLPPGAREALLTQLLQESENESRVETPVAAD